MSLDNKATSMGPQPAAKPERPAVGPAGEGKVADAKALSGPVGQPKTGQPPKPAPKRGEVVRHPAAEVRVAEPARPRPRHRIAAISFLLAVVLPSLGAAAYLYFVAADQYASRMSFSIRGNENASPVSFLGALSQTVTLGGTDAEIVYEFVRSQQMVEAASAALPLREMYNLPQRDMVFRLGESYSIEGLTRYWNRVNTISFDGASGIVQFEARAFDPQSAQAVTSFVLGESTRMVNEISIQARDDAVEVARSVLDQAEDRLRAARRKIRSFRDYEQALDPSQDARAAMELTAALRLQRVEAEIELDSYLSLVGPRGPRVPALRQRIASLEERIAEEERLVGAGAGGASEGGERRRFADLMGEYEELQVDLEFAQNAYVSALTSYEQAQVEARRQIRFLSPHVSPTLSVEAEYPQRTLIAIAIFVILTVAWSVLFLIAYNIRDRR